MIVRVVRGRKWTDYTCGHVSRDDYDDGIDLILWELNGEPNKQKTIMLPQHGKKVFFMNDKGDTVDCVTWAPK